MTVARVTRRFTRRVRRQRAFPLAERNAFSPRAGFLPPAVSNRGERRRRRRERGERRAPRGEAQRADGEIEVHVHAGVPRRARGDGAVRCQEHAPSSSGRVHASLSLRVSRRLPDAKQSARRVLPGGGVLVEDVEGGELERRGGFLRADRRARAHAAERRARQDALGHRVERGEPPRVFVRVRVHVIQRAGGPGGDSGVGRDVFARGLRLARRLGVRGGGDHHAELGERRDERYGARRARR